MTQKPKILITNDDGIYAPGIKMLWQALADYADLTIIAPSGDQSGMGLAITLRSPLQVEAVDWERGTPAWKVNGTPADCVKLALGVILPHKPDLIVSGINRGSNSGRTVLYSGTVGGAIEGALRRVPGIAFSLEDANHPNFASIAHHIFPIVQHVIDNPLPVGTILNVNFPFDTSDIKGMKLARQGQSYWIDQPDQRIHPEGSPYFWLAGRWSDHAEHEESDVALLQKGYITAVPIHIDELTDHDVITAQQENFGKLFKGSLKDVESK